MVSKEYIIPKDVTVEIISNEIIAKKSNNEVRKKLIYNKEIKIEIINEKFKVSSKSDKRKIKAQVGTIIAHTKNIVNGVIEGYTYKMKIIYSHFPVTIKIENNKIMINNFLGERIPRISKIVGSTQVKIEKQDVTITGRNLEEVSQTAANLEQTCRIVGYDKKVFQDGIYITSKND